jgi:GMP synthase-like glutamine amidotransferase
MNIAVLQHSKGTPPGTLLDWIKEKGRSYQLVKLHEGDALPKLSDVHMVVVLGGPMNVDDVEKHPWLRDEKEFLRQAIAAQKTCLGLCLGGQLLAQVLGATVKKHTHWEVGWHPVFFGHEGADRLMVFQFHQDTFDIPQGATRIATNRICENQGFIFGRNVVGLQFHPEASEEWVRECATEKPYPEGQHVQPVDQVIEDIVFITPMRKWFFSLLDRMESVTRERL